VLGGVALLAAFPLAFAVILPALYFPIVVMLLALVFRGVAFEFRYRDAPDRTFWDWGFSIGSGVASFAQGVMLGAFIQGFEVEGRVYSGASFDFLTPFSLAIGVALMFGYCLLGAGWLVLKTEGDLQRHARRWGQAALLGVGGATAVVSLWTPIAHAEVAQRWFAWPNIALLAPIPIATAAAWLYAFVSFRGRSEAGPFVGSILLFVGSYIGMAVSLFPYIVPYRVTLWEAASSPSTQAFLAVGTLLLLPIILTYTAWSYWVFRGKVRADVGYH
jgi:cytochrome d ubiquinol oxidase subunit II